MSVSPQHGRWYIDRMGRALCTIIVDENYLVRWTFARYGYPLRYGLSSLGCRSNGRGGLYFDSYPEFDLVREIPTYVEL